MGTYQCKIQNWRKKIMNIETSPYPAFAEEAVNIIIGKSIGRNILSGIRHGFDISRSEEYDGNVLYVNTVQTSKQLDESIAQVLGKPAEEPDSPLPPDHRCIYFLTVHQGELARRKWDILEYIMYKKVKTVIINSWEWASKNFSYREELLFFFQELTEGTPYGSLEPASVLIYSQMRKVNPEAGMLQRGGLGKLAAMAQRVINIVPQHEKADTAAKEKKSKTETEAPTSDIGLQTSDLSPIPTSDLSPVQTLDLSKMPIHQNNYSPDKPPIPETRTPKPAPSRAPVLKNDVVENKEVAKASATVENERGAG
jgi:hypothetical protein